MSVDAMLGLLNNANQTATILESQRSVSDAMRSANEKSMNSLLQSLNLDNQKTDNLINMNNSFANQNLNSVSSSLKDLIQSGANINLSAIERNGANAVSATDRVGSLLSHSIERIGGENMNATDRNGAANLVASERIGNNLANLLNQNNNLLNTSVKEGQVISERNFGETRLFNATQNQNLERRIGDYHLQSERNFSSVNNDLLKVENSLGRLMDNHYNAGMVELLKIHTALEKGIDRSENNLMRQSADNYANIQIEAAKNKLGLEQKLTEIGNDIKLTLIKDNNDTRALLNSQNNDNIRNDLQAEKIIHALHHHHHHDHHRHHEHDRDRHHHYYPPPFFPYGQFPLQQTQQPSPRN
jgi:hypothetical protein